jgi:hypothetical protein
MDHICQSASLGRSLLDACEWHGGAGVHRQPIRRSYCGVGAGPAGEQLLEPLALFERRLHPEVGGSRQNAFSERQDAFYIEFLELAC